MNVFYPSAGARVLGKGRVEFRVWAPHARQVTVRLIKEGRNEDLAMKPSSEDVFTLLTDRAAPGDRYFYVLDGDKQRPDPVSFYLPETVHGPSQVVDLSKVAVPACGSKTKSFSCVETCTRQSFSL